jgi:radical SAM superfamily enzyme YgiQ (UPF0313 family)
MHVVLINPPAASEVDKHWARFPILGLAYIASSLRGGGHRVTLLDGKLAELSVEQIIEGAADAAPDLIGMTVEFPMCGRIADRIKERLQVPIVIGGAHVNAVKAAVLEECPSIDYACIGEGEHLVLELAAALESGASVADIPGLAFRNRDVIAGAGHVGYSSERPYPKDYDPLPFPAWDLFNTGEQIPVLTHRGCPFHCTFCGHNSGFKARFRTPQNVVEEIIHDVEMYKPEIIRFEDETFGLDLKRTKTIIQLIMQNGLHKKVRFSAQTRVDKIDEEFVNMLKEANFETLELGVETGNAKIMESIKKRITLEQVENAVYLAKKSDLRVWCKFILGHPGETIDTIRDTLRFIWKLNPDQLSVSIMTPYPGTPIHEMAMKGEGGYRMVGEGWDKYDKYSSGVLELEGVTLRQLKLYQILCYAALYLGNWRVGDAIKLVQNHFKMAASMLIGALR